MKVVFIAPSYPPEQCEFTRGLAEVGASVIGVGDGPQGGLPTSVQRALSAYLRVPNWLDEEDAALTIARAVGDLGIDRVESNWEPLVLLAARVRELLGLGGMSRDTVLGFRDKQLMKERVKAAGLRVPRSERVTTEEEVREAADRVGFPLIIKPIAGAGSADTYRCNHQAELERTLPLIRHVSEVSVEEFIEGEEFTYDTVCINGEPVFESVGQYFPRPLIFRSEEWVSPAQLVYRDIYDPDRKLVDGIKLGRGVMKALGMGTGFTHMEWYRKSDGEVVLGEIGCRNGGGHFVDMMNWSNDFDIYREWARSVCWESFEAAASRRYHVGLVFKRASGQGRIQRIDGMDAMRSRYGRHIVADRLLPLGARRRDWKQTLLSDGFVGFRHRDLAPLREMMGAMSSQVHLFAG
jgi:biotin carboxylase